MDIKIKNLGKIKTANITVNGLTVIAGENDTGKSTVGKLLFSIVKAISRYEQDLLEGKEYAIIRRIESLYFRLRKYKHFDIEVKNEFNPRNFVNQLKPFFNQINQLSLFGPQNSEEELKELLNHKSEILKSFDLVAFEANNKLLKEIFDEIFVNEEKENIIKRALERALFSEFYFELTQKGTNRKAIISASEGSSEIFNIEINNNKIETFDLYDELFYNDVTFLETPILLQMYDVIRNSNTLFDDEKRNSTLYRPQVSLHIKDLVTKIENSKLFSNSHFENNFMHIDTLKNISEIINGGFSFEKEDKDFLFTQRTSKKTNIQIKPVNTASGIKSFGIIQLLIQANILDERSLLIIDEPENHLHPKWQLEYARLITELVKNDITVIISSHSPYMIQALKFFTEKEKLTDKTNYYFAENNKEDKYADFRNVNDDLNIIFSKLAEPLVDLVWKQ